MKILWLASTEDDLEALTDFIAKDKPYTALHIFQTIRQTVNTLASYPMTGREGRITHTRELVILISLILSCMSLPKKFA